MSKALSGTARKENRLVLKVWSNRVIIRITRIVIFIEHKKEITKQTQVWVSHLGLWGLTWQLAEIDCFKISCITKTAWQIHKQTEKKKEISLSRPQKWIPRPSDWMKDGRALGRSRLHFREWRGHIRARQFCRRLLGTSLPLSTSTLPNLICLNLRTAYRSWRISNNRHCTNIAFGSSTIG